jgi:hypothetical protein
MDDYFGISLRRIGEPSIPVEMQQAIDFINHIGFAIAPEKNEAGVEILVTGILIHTMNLTFSLPLHKHKELLSLLEDWISTSDSARPLRDWQSLTGTLNWAGNVYLYLKPGLSPIYPLLGPAGGRAFFRLKIEPARLALRWLHNHIATTPPLRLLTLETWHPTEANYTFYADACLTGFGVWFPSRRLGIWWRSDSPVLDPLTGSPLHISSLELFACLMGVWYGFTHLRWAVGNRILGHTDNSQVQAAFHSLHTTVAFNSSLLRLWVDWQPLFPHSFRVAYIPGPRNVIADALSRQDWQYLRTNVPDATIIALSLCDLPALSFPYHSTFS